MKQVAGSLRLDLAQFLEFAAFAQFKSEMDAATLSLITRGERMRALLNQDRLSPLPMEKQVMIIFVGTKGYLDDVPVELIEKFEGAFYKYVYEKYPEIPQDIADKEALDEALTEKLELAVSQFKEFWKNGLTP